MPQLKPATIVVFIVVIALFLAVFYIYKQPAVKEAKWETKRIIRYVFTLENKSSNVLQGVVFKTYSPLVLSSTQKLIKLESNKKFSKKTDKFGNQEMIFVLEFVPPYGKTRISITAELMLSKIVAGAGIEDELFLSTQPLIETDNKDIKAFAKSFNGNSAKTSKEIFNWLVDNIDYSGYGMRDRGALYALKNLRGDCTEYAYLNVALNRALGIPARAVNGYVLEHDSKLNTSEFHTWSEIWLDNAWQIIDAQKNNYLQNQQDYIAMNIEIDTHTDKQEFKRFWVSNPDLIVTMN